MPEHYGALSPILHVVPLQLLAYHTACARGTDVDKPQEPGEERDGRMRGGPQLRGPVRPLPLEDVVLDA